VGKLTGHGRRGKTVLQRWVNGLPWTFRDVNGENAHDLAETARLRSGDGKCAPPPLAPCPREEPLQIAPAASPTQHAALGTR